MAGWVALGGHLWHIQLQGCILLTRELALEVGVGIVGVALMRMDWQILQGVVMSKGVVCCTVWHESFADDPSSDQVAQRSCDILIMMYQE
jgi:hypothetical protein